MEADVVLDRIDREAYPWQPQALAVDDRGHEMAYLDVGRPDADPVLMVHGNPTWSYFYRDLIRRLESDHRCIVPDHIGFGSSDKPSEPVYYSLKRHTRNLCALVRHLDLHNVTLIVHDWGGPIGLGCAIRHPERFKRIILLNTWGMRPDGLLELPTWFRLMRSRGIGEILYLKQNAMIERLMPLWLRLPRRQAEQVMAAYRAPFQFPDQRRGMLRFVRMFPSRPGDESYEELGDTEAGLRDLDVPVHALWGRKDPVLGKRIAHAFMERFPQGSADHIIDIPEAGHFLLEDAPEDVCRHIEKLVRT